MELFQRVRELKKIAGSLDSLAKSMGIAPQQLSAYSNVKSQKNFFEYLPKILECYPNVRREWLYWGEEPMLKSEVSNPELDSPLASQLADTNRIIAETNARLVGLLEVNQKLLEEMIALRAKG